PRPEPGLCERLAQPRVSVELGREAAQLVAQLQRRRIALRVGHLEQRARVAAREPAFESLHGLGFMLRVLRGARRGADRLRKKRARIPRAPRAGQNARAAQDRTTISRGPALRARPTTRAPASFAASAAVSGSGTSSSRPPEVCGS